MPKYNIQVENSAPSQNKPAKSVVWASNILKKYNINNTVDFGCGRLRNLDVLKANFNRILLVDTNLQYSRIRHLIPNKQNIQFKTTDDFFKLKTKFQSVFLVSVLHTIPVPSYRKYVLKELYNHIKQGGYLIIDVPTNERYYRQKCTEDNKYYDGYVMGDGSLKTFYKNYTAKELDSLIKKHTNFLFFKKVYFNQHIIRIFKK